MNTEQMVRGIADRWACSDCYSDSCDCDCTSCHDHLHAELVELVEMAKMEALSGEYEKTEDWTKCKDELYKALKQRVRVEALDDVVVRVWGDIPNAIADGNEAASEIEKIVEQMKKKEVRVKSCETCEDYCQYAGHCTTGQGCQPDGVSARMYSKGYWEGRANFVADAIKEIQRLYHDGGELEDLEGWLRQQR